MPLLERLICQIPMWKEVDFKPFHKIRASLDSMVSSPGTGNSLFDQKYRHFQSLAAQGSFDAAAELNCNASIRALSLLWQTEDFRSLIPVTETIIHHISTVYARLGRLTLGYLCGVYFHCYDHLGSARLPLASLLLRHLEIKHPAARRKHALTALLVADGALFNDDAVAWVSQTCRDRNLSLNQLFDEVGLSAYHGGRFHHLCIQSFYLDTLRAIPVGSDHEVLSYLVDPQTANSLYSGEGRLIGHEAVAIMIDRSTEISPSWRQAIITIAGDPRVPESSPAYRKWWASLGQERVDKYSSWLSAIDLEVFLKIISEYAKESGNKQLIEMFPARRAFLLGLYRQGLVGRTRLFLSKRAVKYLEKNYKISELPSFARLNDANRSVIYFQVGPLHIMEGSHSYRFWIFPSVPSDSRFLDLSQDLFDYQELSTDIKETFSTEDDWRILSATHNTRNFSWQVAVIGHLRMLGVQLDLEPLFSPEDYQVFIKVRKEMLL